LATYQSTHQKWQSIIQQRLYVVVTAFQTHADIGSKKFKCSEFSKCEELIKLLHIFANIKNRLPTTKGTEIHRTRTKEHTRSRSRTRSHSKGRHVELSPSSTIRKSPFTARVQSPPQPSVIRRQATIVKFQQKTSTAKKKTMKLFEPISRRASSSSNLQAQQQKIKRRGREENEERPRKSPPRQHILIDMFS